MLTYSRPGVFRVESLLTPMLNHLQGSLAASLSVEHLKACSRTSYAVHWGRCRQFNDHGYRYSQKAMPKPDKEKPQNASVGRGLIPSPPQVHESGDMIEVRLSEYKALRDESLRCAQLLSNILWVAITGYAVTLGAGAAFLGKGDADNRQVLVEFLVPAFALLLCVESIAISAIYLSELWKYIRVGAYIRDHIEPYFRNRFSAATGSPPMNWENWIRSHRARAIYLGSLTFLQLPILVTALGAGIATFGGTAPVGSIHEFLGWLVEDLVIRLLLVIVLTADVVIIFTLFIRLFAAETGDFQGLSRALFVKLARMMIDRFKRKQSASNSDLPVSPRPIGSE